VNDLRIVREAVRAEQRAAESVEKLKDKHTPIKKSLLSDDLQGKFKQLEDCQSFEEKTECLTWAVDAMRSDILDHFEAAGVLEDMDDKEKQAILKQIDDTQLQCKDELFKMHKDNAEGKLVEETASFS
jgi:hypothetical protein